LVSLLLLGDILLLALVFVSFLLFGVLTFFLLVVLSVLLWASLLEVFLVVVVLVVALVLIALWSWGTVVLHVVCHLRNEHLWLLSVEVKSLNLSLHGHWSWAQVLVWVEASDSRNVSNVRYLYHSILLTVVADVLIGWREWRKRVCAGVINGIAIVIVIAVAVAIIVPVLLELLRHWRKGDTFWQIRKWINEASLLINSMEEGAQVQ
jgi:hypothetical protein